MALSQDIIQKSRQLGDKINGSNLDDDYKNTLNQLVDIATTATNGISSEEKIQKMTEGLFYLVYSQVKFISEVDSNIQKAITSANVKQCGECKALKYTTKMEKEEERKKIIEDYKKEQGIDDEQKEPDKIPETIQDTIKMILLKPYVWLFGIVLVFSPYGTEMLKVVFEFFKK